jgi:hypothetical protein
MVVITEGVESGGRDRSGSQSSALLTLPSERGSVCVCTYMHMDGELVLFSMDFLVWTQDTEDYLSDYFSNIPKDDT